MPKDSRLKTGPAADPRPVRCGVVGRGRRTPPHIQFPAAGPPRPFETARDTGGAAFPRSAFRVQLFRLSLFFLTVPLWQGKIEGRALAGLALNPDPPAMELDDMFHDAQAKAGAAFLAGAPLVDPIKPLEDMGKVRGGYAWPVVPDAHFGLPLLEPRIYFDPRSTRGVLEGVIEKVVADLDDAERSTQFVGGIGDKILPDGFQPLLLGDVVEDK